MDKFVFNLDTISQNNLEIIENEILQNFETKENINKMQAYEFINSKIPEKYSSTKTIIGQGVLPEFRDLFFNKLANIIYNYLIGIIEYIKLKPMHLSIGFLLWSLKQKNYFFDTNSYLKKYLKETLFFKLRDSYAGLEIYQN